MSWKKVRLGDILKQYRIEHRVDDTAIYKQVSILNDGSVVLRGEKIGKEIGRKRQFIIDIKKYPNTLIFTRQLLLQGSIGIASNDVHNCIVTENMPMFSIDTTRIDKEFLMLFLKTEVFKSRIREIELSGSAQKSIHERTFSNLEFSLPPFEKQKEMVFELLKLKSNSDTISTELTHQLTLVKKLRQQLLQDAVQGKLVPQNKKDEPASELLRKIKAEKAELIAEKKLKKDKELPPIKPEEIPFEIPENWVWCRLGEIGEIVRGGSPRPAGDPTYYGGAIPFLKVGDLTGYDDIYVRTHTHSIKEAGLYKTRFVDADTLMLTNSGATLGIPRICAFPTTFNDGIAAFLNLNNINKVYLYYFLKSKSAWYLKEASRGQGQPNLNTDIIALTPFPFPPLSEQQRIVERLEQVMQHCNELEASIKESESHNEKLLQQVLREALRKE
jgi:type I restriction enzyme S subunit